jgi:hypothetical protein
MAIAAILCLSAAASVATAQETLQREGVVVNYSGVSPEYAEAIARTVSTARSVAIDRFGFDMPDTITVTVQLNADGNVRLFNDGQDRFSLTIRSGSELLKPSQSGIFHLYGLCHEVGHLAMYRPVRDKRWMTTAAAEGWAHYLGSRIVDEVHAREGSDLWPDRYDYLNDGTRRLEKQLASPEPGAVANGAGLWKELVAMVGDRGVAPIFQAWGSLEVDPADPEPQLGEALKSAATDTQIQDWWDRAQVLFVDKRPRSRFVAQTVARQSAGESEELALDDGEAAGKQSIAGGGHAVRFEVSDGSFYLTEVQIHGARYGTVQPPNEDFRVWLCDADFRSIAEFKFPYSKFTRGTFDWVGLSIPPTQVPTQFFVCVGFNPTATKGVYVSYDAADDGASYVGLPGRNPGGFSRGDWLIRATVARQSKTRTWTDSTGKFSLRAELVDAAEGIVRLKKADGEIISLPIEKLSDADQDFVRSQTQEPPADAPSTVMISELSGNPEELAQDDGRPAGKKSFPRGHAVAFEAPGDSYYMTSVRIHGGRYGHPQAPKEDFHVTLCDPDFRTIVDFPFAYSKFQRGDPKWVSLRVKPTRVPKKFVICVNFNPTRTKGVYVSHDAEGTALVGLPGKPAGSFTGGDWLIHVTVDRRRQ